MSKKKLLILPIVTIMVLIMGISVFAGGSPTPFIKIYSGQTDVTDKFTCSDCSKIDLSKVSGLQAEINKVNSKLKVSDFNKSKAFVAGYNIVPVNGYAADEDPYKVIILQKVPKDSVGIVVHQKPNKSYEYRVFKGDGDYAYIDKVSDFSPFCLYVAKPSSSPQTGDSAPFYIAAIAVVLLSGGVFFAVCAKKATKKV